MADYKEIKNVKYDLIKKLDLTLTRNVNGKDISYSLSDYIINYNLYNTLLEGE